MNAVLKKAPPRQFSISTIDKDLRETGLHETSKRAALIQRTLIVRRTLSIYSRMCSVN